MRPIRLLPLILFVALLALSTAGCASRVWPVDYPNNWLTLDGSHIADSQVYYNCLRASRNMESESQSNIGGGAFGGGTATISGSSSSRQSMKTDVPLLTACMASKGYRLRNPDESGPKPYAVATPMSLRSRKAWIIEASSSDKSELYWMGSWVADQCERWFRELVSKPPNARFTFRACRTGSVNEERSGSEVWLAAGSEIFTGGATEERCQYVVERMKMASPPACRKLWIRMD
jgi:hypothetical protein